MTDWWQHIPVAHRGLHIEQAGVIENSLPAFAAAVEAGYAIELDLRPSRENEAIVFHDGTLERLTGARGFVETHSAEHLTTLTLSGGDAHIPCLADVLALVGGRVPLLLEIKAEDRLSDALNTRITDLLVAYQGDVAVQSFNPDVVLWFARRLPRVPRGLLARRAADLVTPAVGVSHFIAYDVNALPAPAPALARLAGRPVIAWTVRDNRTWSIATAHADNIIFEGIRPLVARGH